MNRKDYIAPSIKVCHIASAGLMAGSGSGALEPTDGEQTVKPNPDPFNGAFGVKRGLWNINED